MIVPIVPLPAHVSELPGTYTLPHSVTISAASADERNVADFAAAFLRERGVTAVIVPSGKGATLRLSTAAKQKSLGNEGYRLRIERSGITISANAGAGLYYGLQSLEQLFPANNRSNTLHDLAIEDAPAFAWRGMMLDVARHFYDVPTVERYIDLAAHYKLNTFHWHLADDQGWRVEIKQYPRLISVGSCRAGTQVGKNPNDVDDSEYCGHYTQDQIREVVAYAAKRYVRIVPEIDMPGHSSALVASYPELGCSDKPVQVKTTWSASTAICPTEKAITFEENVLSELMQLFPGPYIHTGGDEVLFSQWKASPFVTELMKREHLTTYPEVQAYFERRIEQFIESKGRRMVGWDEILRGGVSQHAVIMSWRGVRGGILAAQKGNDAVMTPDGPLYFDAYQGDRNLEPEAIGNLSTLQMVYNYDPLAGLTTQEQRSHILGVQANIWTEWIGSVPKLFYMALPRELALSEDAWTQNSQKNWDSFVARTAPQYTWLQNAQYNFRIPNPTFTVAGGSLRFSDVTPSLQTTSAQTDASHVTISLSDPVPNATLFYSTDGNDPDSHSLRYTHPLHLTLAPGQRIHLTAAAILPSGRSSTPSELILTRKSGE